MSPLPVNQLQFLRHQLPSQLSKCTAHLTEGTYRLALVNGITVSQCDFYTENFINCLACFLGCSVPLPSINWINMDRLSNSAVGQVAAVKWSSHRLSPCSTASVSSMFNQLYSTLPIIGPHLCSTCYAEESIYLPGISQLPESGSQKNIRRYGRRSSATRGDSATRLV